MNSKECFKCHKTLPLDDFHKHPQMGDGHLNKCKDCARRDVTRNRSLRSDYYKEFDRQRANLPHRVADRARRAKTKKSIDAKKGYLEKSIAKYPYKNQARNLVAKAIKHGELKRVPCSVCGAEKSHAHHEDYTKPLDVVWLCTKHHAQRHRELEAATRILIAEKNWCNGW